MNGRIGTGLALTAAAVFACTPGDESFVGFVPNLFSLSVLPPPGGGTHTIEPGGTIAIDIEMVMGVNVSGEDIEIRLEEADLPAGVTLAPGEFELQFGRDLAAGERQTFRYNIVASPTAPPGAFQVTVEGSADITDDVTSTEFATFTLIVGGQDGCTDFSLASEATPYDAAAGGPLQRATINIDRQPGFVGAVSFSLEGPTDGVLSEWGFVPDPSTEPYVAFDFVVAPTATPGSYDYVLRGTAADNPASQCTLDFRINVLEAG